MNKEYRALKVFERVPNHPVFPKQSDCLSELSKFLSENEITGFLEDFKQRGFIEDLVHDRTGLTKVGTEYLDKRFWLEQAFDIVDRNLKNLVNYNDAIDNRHIRHIHKIEQKADIIIEDYSLIKYLSHNKSFSMGEILPNGRYAIEDCGGIENYINSLNDHQAAINAESIKMAEMEKEIKRLTYESLVTDSENKELKQEIKETKLLLQKAQLVDIPVNAIDRKTMIFWTILISIVAIAGWLTAILKW